MPGRSRRLALAALLILLVTGVALATPVPVVALSGGGPAEVVRGLDDGEPFLYSYRQSIYNVPVLEEFVRAGDRLRLVRVRSSDIRSVEYFRWDGNIVQDDKLMWSQEAPPNDHQQLIIQVTPLGDQRMSTPRWTIDLLGQFGRAIVTLRVDRRPRALTLFGGTS